MWCFASNSLMIWFLPSSFPPMPTNGKLALSLSRLSFQKERHSLALPNVTDNSFYTGHKSLISLTKVAFPFKGKNKPTQVILSIYCNERKELYWWYMTAFLINEAEILNSLWEMARCHLFLPLQVKSVICSIRVGVWGYNTYQNFTF